MINDLIMYRLCIILRFSFFGQVKKHHVLGPGPGALDIPFVQLRSNCV